MLKVKFDFTRKKRKLSSEIQRKAGKLQSAIYIAFHDAGRDLEVWFIRCYFQQQQQNLFLLHRRVCGLKFCFGFVLTQIHFGYICSGNGCTITITIAQMCLISANNIKNENSNEKCHTSSFSIIVNDRWRCFIFEFSPYVCFSFYYTRGHCSFSCVTLEFQRCTKLWSAWGACDPIELKWIHGNSGRPNDTMHVKQRRKWRRQSNVRISSTQIYGTHINIKVIYIDGTQL